MAERTDTQIIIGIIVAVSVGAFIAWAGSDGSIVACGLPVFAICGTLAFAINWAVFIPAALTQSEHYYDLTGGVTYITATAVAIALSNELDLRAMLVAAMVMVWSLRLASFLFMRISAAGSDSRFDTIKTRPARFLLAWTLQGLWVLLTAATAWVVITSTVRVPLGVIGTVGIIIWSSGMLIEIISDNQKSKFRANPANAGKFISSGLWAWSRHPNYFGEITLWVGMAIVALPVLTGWQWFTLISPIFVAFLLIKISGIPMLEETADKRWGGLDDYEAYKRNTPVLLPKPPTMR